MLMPLSRSYSERGWLVPCSNLMWDQKYWLNLQRQERRPVKVKVVSLEVLCIRIYCLNKLFYLQAMTRSVPFSLMLLKRRRYWRKLSPPTMLIGERRILLLAETDPGQERDTRPVEVDPAGLPGSLNLPRLCHTGRRGRILPTTARANLQKSLVLTNPSQVIFLHVFILHGIITYFLQFCSSWHHWVWWSTLFPNWILCHWEVVSDTVMIIGQKFVAVIGFFL